MPSLKEGRKINNKIAMFKVKKKGIDRNNNNLFVWDEGITKENEWKLKDKMHKSIFSSSLLKLNIPPVGHHKHY